MCARAGLSCCLVKGEGGPRGATECGRGKVAAPLTQPCLSLECHWRGLPPGRPPRGPLAAAQVQRRQGRGVEVCSRAVFTLPRRSVPASRFSAEVWAAFGSLPCRCQFSWTRFLRFPRALRPAELLKGNWSVRGGVRGAPGSLCSLVLSQLCGLGKKCFPVKQTEKL